MGTRITHVFFDATDTLLRVRGSVGSIYAEVAQRHGVQVSSAALAKSFGPAVANLPQDVAPDRSPADILASERRWWFDVARDTFRPHVDLGAFADFDAFFEELFATFQEAHVWELLPGVRETLDTLRAQSLHCGIISDMDSRLLLLLPQLGLDEHFSSVFLSFRTGYCKPDARLFTTACAANAVAPDHAVHVGDSWKKDVLGARNAGLHAVWYRPQGSDDAHRPWVAAMTELPPLLATQWPEDA